MRKTKLTIFLAVISLVLFGMAGVASAAYQPPVGIPNPATSWGGTQDPIDNTPPSRPSVWTSEQPGYFYIDSATGCSDSRVYGYPGFTRCTIPNPIPAGSFVELHGTHTASPFVWIHGLGTGDTWSANTAGPVWVVGQDGDQPIITGKKTVVYGSYIYLYNLKFSGVPSGEVLQISSLSAGYQADHIAILNSDISGTNTSGVGVSVVANAGYPVSNVLLHNNAIHDHGPSYDTDQDSHMIGVGSYVNNAWILNNALYNSSGSGMQFGAASPGPNFVYVGKNTVNNSRQAGIATKYATDIIISENIIHDVKDRCVGIDTSPSKGIGAQYAPTRVWWINNEIFNVRYGIYMPSTNTGVGEVYAIGNIIHDIDYPTTYKPDSTVCYDYPTGNNTWGMGAIMFYGSITKWIVNNTIYNAVSGIYDASTVYGSNIYNNIISNITHPNGYALYTETQTKTNLDFSLFYNTAGNMIRWGAGGLKYPTLAEFQTAQNKALNSVEGDPLFVNSATNDFHMQALSPAKDSGVADVAYSVFFARYGIDIQKDIAGTTRPQGSAWDIGAYEYISSAPDTTPPSAPTGLVVL